jgi:hypothetical protein
MSPTDNEIHVVLMLQHLEWCSLEDRHRDARSLMMYKISHDKVAVSKSARLSKDYKGNGSPEGLD